MVEWESRTRSLLEDANNLLDKGNADSAGSKVEEVWKFLRDASGFSKASMDYMKARDLYRERYDGLYDRLLEYGLDLGKLNRLNFI